MFEYLSDYDSGDVTASAVDVIIELKIRLRLAESAARDLVGRLTEKQRLLSTRIRDEINNTEGSEIERLPTNSVERLISTLARRVRGVILANELRSDSIAARPKPFRGVCHYVSAKVVLLGESGTGKTALAHRLVEDRFVRTESTHGMNVFRLNLRLAEDSEVEREVLLWDLAGQADYRLIHQLYLDDIALALLVIDPQRDDPFADAGVWLNALRSADARRAHRRDPAKLLVLSRVDRGGMTVSPQKLNQFVREHGFLGCVSTSAKTGDNCATLKHLIARCIPWDELPRTSAPRLLTKIRTAVAAMSDEADIPLLRFGELLQRLEHVLPEEQFSGAEVRTAVALLANHGLVYPLEFGDLVLLRPDLLNGYAGAMVRAARAHKDAIGCVSAAAIYQGDLDFAGVDRLKNRPDEELLLRAMVQIFLDKALCIAEDTETGRHLIFPSQYRRERPIPSHPEIFVSYTFAGELQTVYTTLVVRLWYSREFQHKELWQNAAEFKTVNDETVGLVMTRAGEGEGSISVFFEGGVPDELKLAFIKYVQNHLAKHATKLRLDRRYICPACGKPVTDLLAVRERLEAKKDFITCQKCDERVPLIDSIEQRLGSDSVARRVLGMEQKAIAELDAQALEQILIGHMMAICGEANQIYRPVPLSEYGIDAEVEFKDNHGTASGRKIYLQLNSGTSHLCTQKADGKEIFNVKNPQHLDYWVSQPVDVYLVIRDEKETIRWTNITGCLRAPKDKPSRQIVFEGEKLDAPAMWRVRDQFIARVAET
jgi:RNase P subunit RPR2